MADRHIETAANQVKGVIAIEKKGRPVLQEFC